jgi:hypothetical protein
LEIELKDSLGIIFKHPLYYYTEKNRDIYVNLELSGEENLKITSDHLIWVEEINIFELSRTRDDFLISLLHKIFWSLSIRYMTNEEIMELMEKNKLKNNN